MAAVLAAPLTHTELLRSLLPKSRFGEARDSDVYEFFINTISYDDELRGFVEKFQKAKELLKTSALLSSAQSAGATDAMLGEQTEATVWELLMKRVVLGSSATEEVYGNLAPAFREAAQSAMEDVIMHDLERFSMELQRHCPQDWNQCSTILVHCLQSDGQKTSDAAFKV